LIRTSTTATAMCQASLLKDASQQALVLGSPFSPSNIGSVASQPDTFCRSASSAFFSHSSASGFFPHSAYSAARL
jgi:hypothetical protein